MEQRRRSTWKGERRQINAHIPLDMFNDIAQRAEGLGVTKVDLLLHAVCLYMERPDVDPLRDRSGEQPEQMRMTA